MRNFLKYFSLFSLVFLPVLVQAQSTTGGLVNHTGVSITYSITWIIQIPAGNDTGTPMTASGTVIDGGVISLFSVGTGSDCAAHITASSGIFACAQGTPGITSFATEVNASLGGFQQIYVKGGTTFDAEIQGSPCSDGPCRTNVSFSFHNQDSVTHSVQVHFGGTSVGPYTVGPGETVTDELSIPCDDAANQPTYSINTVPGTQPLSTNTVVSTNSLGNSITNTTVSGFPDAEQTNGLAVVGGTNVPTPVVINPPTTSIYNASNTPSPILWSPATDDDAGIIKTIKDGDSALYDAVTKFTKQNHTDLTGVSGALAGLTNLHVSATVTNGSGFGTNVFSLTNYAQENTLEGISNLLARAGSTNGSGTNGGSGTVPSSATNATAAQTAAGAAQGDYGVDGLIAQLTPTLPSASPSAPDMTVSMFGTIIDLDPVHEFPGVAAFAIIGWRIVLLLVFFLELANTFWKLVHVQATAQTGGVPDLDVAGVNVFTGTVVALAVPVAFIALFSASMIYIFSDFGYSITEAMGITAFSDSMGSTAYYLLASFFPVNLAFGLICTRILFIFTLAKLVALGAAASRFLWGK